MFTIRHRREAREPVPDERVAALLDAAAAPTEPGPASGEPAALAAFRASHRTTGRGRSRLFSSPTPLRTAAAAAIGAGVLLTGGVAAAQTGSLPAPAQDAAQAVLAKVGLSVPGADGRARGHADQSGASTDAPRGSEAGAEADAPAQKPSEHTNHGAEVSETAKNTPLTGVAKGKAVSDLASAQGQAQRDEHANAEAPSGSAAQVTTPNTGGTSRPEPAGSHAQGAGTSQDRPPAPVPDGGGSGTADAAGSGASVSGTTTAGERSGGRSTAGSGNADSHTDNRPANPSANRP